MSLESLDAGKALEIPPERREGPFPVTEDALPLEEVADRERRGEAGGAAGRQDVIGARPVVGGGNG